MYKVVTAFNHEYPAPVYSASVSIAANVMSRNDVVVCLSARRVKTHTDKQLRNVPNNMMMGKIYKRMTSVTSYKYVVVT